MSNIWDYRGETKKETDDEVGCAKLSTGERPTCSIL